MAESRVRSVVAMANRKLTIQWAAALLSASTFIASLLGIYRDRLLNSMYLDSYAVGIDAYTAAFTIPDFMFFILVSGALSVTFIPVFNQRLSTGNKKSAWELSSSMINFMALVTLIASVLIIIFAEPLVRYVVGPGLDESGRALAVSMMRIIAVNPFLFAVATVIASMQQAVGRFTFYALAPTIYNIGIIIGAQFFTHGINLFGWQVFDGGIMGVALGVVLGSMMQLIVSSVGLIGLGFDYQAKISWRNKGFRTVLKMLPARSLDQGIDYFNSLVETNLSSHMAEGTLRAFQQATALSLMPVNLIGVAISNAAFPRMAERLGQNRPDLFKSELLAVLRWIIWLALPVATITYFTRGYVVTFIKNGGNALIAGLLGALVVAILFRTIYHIAARAFYAQQDTRTPLYISLFSITLNIVLAVTFTNSFGWGPYGLAWAQSIVAFIEVVILFVVLGSRIPRLFDAQFWHAITRMVSAAGMMALITYAAVRAFQLQNDDMSIFATFPKFGLIVTVSLVTYVVVSKLLRLREATPVVNKVVSLIPRKQR
ncbi:MAG: lipid II flippase MurJ [Candidatus Saccharimonas sp.]